MQDSEGPTTFHDASACFSEEEWKRLQNWQKELYRNVMKEVHQALLSLGPLIATTVSSLRAKDKDELCRMENQDCESKHWINQPSCFPFFEADICSRKEEPVSIFIDHLGAELRDCTTEPDHGYEVVSFCIKDEEEAFSVKNSGSQRMKCARSPTRTVLPQYQQGVTRKVGDTLPNLEPDDQRLSRKKKVEDSIKHPAIRPPQKVISQRINMMVLPNCDKEANSRNLIWTETYPESIEEKSSHCKRSLSNTMHVSSHQVVGGSHQGVDGSPQYITYKSNMRNSPLCKDLQNTEQDQKTSTCSTDKNYRVKGEFTRNTRTHPRERPYACSECKKRFFQKTHLIVHCRIHSGEKPYMCTFCHKRFNRKDYLNEHIRIHTGERPYKCTECEKSFIQKSHLVYHQRKHAESLKTAT